jgi:hypothetical protein
VIRIPSRERRPRRGRPSRSVSIVALAVAVAAGARPARAEDPPPASVAEDVARLRRDLEEERKARAADRAEFERRLARLEAAPPTAAEVAAAVDEHGREHEPADVHGGAHGDAPGHEPHAHAHAHPGALEPTPDRRCRERLDVALVIDVTLGGSTASDAALSAVNAGDHDPRVSGANVRNEEIILSGGIDPWFDAFAAVVFLIDEEGETRVELEEAYARSACLPFGLELKAGHFLTEFGLTNPVHPHQWEFVNAPAALVRVFGPDLWRGPGARLAWTSCRGAVRALAGLQHPRGETQWSFLGEEGAEIGAHEIQPRDLDGLGDLAWHLRLEGKAAFHGGRGTTTAVLGASAAFGPNGTGPDGRTRIFGADLAVDRRPCGSCCPWPSWSWRTEAVYRDYEADDQVRLVDDGMGGLVAVPVAARAYEDWGLYSEFVWRFRCPWSIGARLEYADSDGAFAGAHARASLALTWYMTSHSRVRLQASYDRVDGLAAAFPGEDDDVLGLWLNFDLALGGHDEHAH